MIWILALVALVAFGYYLVAVKPFKYWKDRGVIQSSPLPIVGDSWRTMFNTETFADFVQHVYKIAPNSRYCGFYQFSMPTLILKDPELIKQITVKDFDHFLDHLNFVPDNADLLWNNNLFSLRGQKWRDMRSTLSPAFTGSKMKQMFGLMTEIAEQFVKHFAEKKQEIVTVEMRDTLTRFANDVIASTAFGVKCDSLEERDNEFYLMGKQVTDFSGFWQNLKFIAFFLFPQLMKSLKMTLFSKAVSDFFLKLVTDNIKEREEHGIVRPDLINILMEARTKGLKYEENSSVSDTGFATVEESEVGKNATGAKQPLTDIDITAQALIFFFAGFDSVSALMCFMCHELAVNPDIQERLRREVDEVDEKCGGKLTYEALSGMKYMDMVTSETLRLWPSNAEVDRVCTKSYTIKAQTPEERDVEIDEGTALWLPIFALHRDEKYFPEPERFEPERFNVENKHKIVPYSYIPFGAGPRNCIASRFALLENKALIFYVLREFEIVPVKETQIPLKISKKQFTLGAENGFWLGLKKRNKASE